jgi:hypothetical protein
MVDVILLAMVIWAPPVGFFGVLLAFVGGLVSVLEFQGLRRIGFAGLFLLLGIGEVISIIKANADHHAEIGQQQDDMQTLRAQNKSDLDAFSKRTDDRLNSLIDASCSAEQKMAATQIKKELQYDPVVLHRMPREQLAEVTKTLTSEMIDFEDQHRKSYNALQEQWTSRMRYEPDAEKQTALFTEQYLAMENDRTSFVGDFRKSYVGRANAVHDELLFRLRLTPEQAQERVVAILAASPFERFTMSLALKGNLSGPRPIGDSAEYLQALSRMLQ